LTTLNTRFILSRLYKESRPESRSFCNLYQRRGNACRNTG
jgi:hypothetical protein